ncbi:MAG: DNA internalization-related competence protein ComEC/Rec2 [Calditrichaeota bacterium]|nr:MAG: DNA internalization-related competence protein ComEC/Rec2 [Calditrichota bacterium]MBL1206282.1 DNA internalization-related competence protein ComEC/Rec2 [Calditrichota bacterium]NOG46108.1 DNA internalization-related competence protein ComEC/Rec2 [Calditrichota bacterium]
MKLIKYYHTLPSLYFFFIFSTGITIGWISGNFVSPIYLMAAFLVILIYAALNFKNDFRLFYAVLILFLLSGILKSWFSLYPFSQAENNLFYNNIDAFQGTIESVSVREGKPDIYLMKCDKVFLKDKMLVSDGFVVISQGKYSKRFKYGDVLHIFGKPQQAGLPTNPGEFNYRRYLQLNNRFLQFRLHKETKVLHIFSGKGNWAQSNIFNKTRHSIRSIIDKHLTGNSASIVKALILGERGNLEKGVVADFQKTGVIHVLAISGLHVAFIALFLQFILSILRVPQKINMALIILFLVFFLALVNFKAPVVRASLMMTVYFIAKFSNRPQNTINIVALSGIAILLFKPEELLLPGFQYSFAAVFGLVYGNSKLNSLLPAFKSNTWFRKVFNKFIRKPFIASFCAILATLPLTWFYFGTFQIGALVANIFVIPIIGIVVFLSIFLLITASIKILPATGIAILLNSVLDFLTWIISNFANLPYVQIVTGHPSLVSIILVTIGIFLFFNAKNSKARLAFLAVTALFLFLTIGTNFQGKNLKITFIHVGQGDAALIEFPNGKNALVDAGNKGFGFDAGERYVDPVLKYYGISKINYLIGSHPHSDHIGGFEFLLDNYFVDTLVMNEFKVSSKIYKRIISKSKQKGVFIKYADEGDIIIPDIRTRIYILHPDTTFETSGSHGGQTINNSSLVFKLMYGNNSFLFSGDAEVESEEAMQNYESFLDVDVLKVGHHGSRTSSSKEFLELVKPEFAIISVGRKNKFKHPAPETLEKFSNLGIEFYRTDQIGAIVIESDGHTLKKVNWR